MNKIIKSSKKLASLILVFMMLISSITGFFVSVSYADNKNSSETFEVQLEKQSSNYLIKLYNGSGIDYNYVTGRTTFPSEITLSGKNESFNWRTNNLGANQTKYLIGTDGAQLSVNLKDVEIKGFSTSAKTSKGFLFETYVTYKGRVYSIVTELNAVFFLKYSIKQLKTDSKLTLEMIDYLREIAFNEDDSVDDRKLDDQSSEETLHYENKNEEVTKSPVIPPNDDNSSNPEENKDIETEIPNQTEDLDNSETNPSKPEDPSEPNPSGNEDNDSPIKDGLQRIGQIAENRYLSGYAFDKDGNLLTEKKLLLIDNDGNVDEVYTDYQGYYTTRLARDSYKLVGDGFEIEIINKDNQEVLSRNIIGATTLGKLIDSDYGYIHYMPSVVYFDDDDDIEYVVSDDETYVMLLSERKVLPNDVISLPQTERFVNGISYKALEVEEANGIQFIKINKPRLAELVNKLDVDSGENGIQYKDMQVFAEKGVQVFRKEDKKTEEDMVDMGASLASRMFVPGMHIPFKLDGDAHLTEDINFVFGLSYDGKGLAVNPTLSAKIVPNINLLGKEILKTTIEIGDGKEAKFQLDDSNARLLEKITDDNIVNAANTKVAVTKNEFIDNVVEIDVPSQFPTQPAEKLVINLTKGTASYGGYTQTLRVKRDGDYHLSDVLNEFIPGYEEYKVEEYKKLKKERGEEVEDDLKIEEFINRVGANLNLLGEMIDSDDINPSAVILANNVRRQLDAEKEAYKLYAETIEKFPEYKKNFLNIFGSGLDNKTRLNNLKGYIAKIEDEEDDKESLLKKLDEASQSIDALELTYLYGMNGKSDLKFLIERTNPINPLARLYIDYENDSNSKVAMEGAINLEIVDKEPIKIATLAHPDPVLKRLFRVDVGVKYELRNGKIALKYVYTQNNKTGFEFDTDKLDEYINKDRKVGKEGQNNRAHKENVDIDGHVEGAVGLNANTVLGLDGLLAASLPTDLLADLKADFMFKKEAKAKVVDGVVVTDASKPNSELIGELKGILDVGLKIGVLDKLDDFKDGDGIVASVLDSLSEAVPIELDKDWHVYNGEIPLWKNWPEPEKEYSIQDPVYNYNKLKYSPEPYYLVHLTDRKNNFYLGDKKFTEYTDAELKDYAEREYGSKGINVKYVTVGNTVYNEIDIRSLFNNNINIPNSDKTYKANVFRPYTGPDFGDLDMYEAHRSIINKYPITTNFRKVTVTEGEEIDIRNKYFDNKDAAKIIGVYNLPNGLETPTQVSLVKGLATDKLVGEHEIFVLRREFLRGFDEVTDVPKTMENDAGRTVKIKDATQENLYFDRVMLEVVKKNEDSVEEPLDIITESGAELPIMENEEDGNLLKDAIIEVEKNYDDANEELCEFDEITSNEEIQHETVESDEGSGDLEKSVKDESSKESDSEEKDAELDSKEGLIETNEMENDKNEEEKELAAANA